MIIGFPGNLGDPVVSIVTAGRRYRLTNSRLIRSPSPRLTGTNKWDATMVSPSEGNEARRDGRQGVAAPHSSVEAGERPFRTP
jgi:hypothetical protein